MVRVGSARIDERGRAIGGKAGDQNGKEVSTQLWYNRIVNPWRVLRFKNPDTGKRAAALMLAACNNKHIGYDQANRQGLYKLLSKLGFNMAAVTTDTETDCSALIQAILACLGIFLRIEIRTWTEVDALLKTGFFIELKGSKYTHSSSYLREGDILCTTRKGHTVMVLDNGPKVGATQEPVYKAVAPTPPALEYMANWVTATAPVNLRTAPSTSSKSRLVIPQGAALMYAGQVSGEWYGVMWRGKVHWMHAKYVKIEVHEKPIIDLSVYRNPDDWGVLKRWVSFVIIRVGIRHLTSNGPITIDKRFKATAKVLQTLGIPFAVFFYGRAKTVAQAAEEAQRSIEWAEAYGPVGYFYDIETPTLNYSSVTAFLNYIRAKADKFAGVYVGRKWNQVRMDDVASDFNWCPYFTKGHSGIRLFGRRPSHPHDMQQNSPSAIYPGGDSRGMDNSFINDDPNTWHKGHDVEWLRSGGKEGR